MIPGLRMEVIADVAEPTHPRAWIRVPGGTGIIALQLDWREGVPVARWTAAPVFTDPFQRLLRDVMSQEEHEPWRTPSEGTEEPITQTAAVNLLLPVAQRWLTQPVRRADSLIIWLRTELLLPQEVQ